MTTVLHGHSDRVNCVAWEQRGADAGSVSSPLLLSGAADNNIIIWKCADGASGRVIHITFLPVPLVFTGDCVTCSRLNVH